MREVSTVSVSDVWPVTLIGWRSKAQEILAAALSGTVSVGLGKGVHVRKGARFVLLLEDGAVLAYGEVVTVRDPQFELRLAGCAASPDGAPALTGAWLERLKAVPRGFLRQPLSGVVVIPDRQDAVIPIGWFDDVYRFAEKRLEATTRVPTASSPAPEPAPSAVSSSPPAPPPAVAPPREAQASSVPAPQQDDERESLLRSWIPPALSGLLADHVRADEWELIVAYAFRALGCRVDIRGQTAPGKVEPDCIATYTTSDGRIFEIVIDAKAGRWTADIDDIRAMRDYMTRAHPYARPLFVANSLAREVPERLRQQLINDKVGRAISGRDLALLISQRFTDPGFSLEMELQRMFL